MTQTEAPVSSAETPQARFGMDWRTLHLQLDGLVSEFGLEHVEAALAQLAIDRQTAPLAPRTVTLSSRALAALDELCGRWKMLVTTDGGPVDAILGAVETAPDLRTARLRLDDRVLTAVETMRADLDLVGRLDDGLGYAILHLLDQLRVKVATDELG
jgi:hypothetical protein